MAAALSVENPLLKDIQGQTIGNRKMTMSYVKTVLRPITANASTGMVNVLSMPVEEGRSTG
jgi:hypothetical protein